MGSWLPPVIEYTSWASVVREGSGRPLMMHKCWIALRYDLMDPYDIPEAARKATK
jgi:hypothetical protein